MYYTYMLRCTDNSIYTGITTDLNHRMKEHFQKTKQGAKYTKTHNAKKLLIAFQSTSKSDASKLEYHIKCLTKVQKEELIVDGNLQEYLKEKIDVSSYHKVNLNHLVEMQYL